MFLDFAFLNCKIAIKKSDNKIVSMLTIIPSAIFMNQNKKAAAYIYAVATSDDYRGRGFSRELMNFAKAYANRENLFALFLVPSAHLLFDFYLKQDFKFASYNYVTVFENDRFDLSEKNCNLYFIESDEYIKRRNLFAGNSKNFVKWSDNYLKYSATEATFCDGGIIGADINNEQHYALYSTHKSTAFITETSIENKADISLFISAFCKKFGFKKCFVKTSFLIKESSVKTNFGMFFSNQYDFSENDNIFLNTVLD